MSKEVFLSSWTACLYQEVSLRISVIPARCLILGKNIRRSIDQGVVDPRRQVGKHDADGVVRLADEVDLTAASGFECRVGVQKADADPTGDERPRHGFAVYADRLPGAKLISSEQVFRRMPTA